MRTFIAMELLEGPTLRRMIAGKPLEIGTVLDLGIQIADALDAAHSTLAHSTWGSLRVANFSAAASLTSDSWVTTAERSGWSARLAIHLLRLQPKESVMKWSRKMMVFLAAALEATAVHAEYGKTPIKHVIVIFQENRTPDNLFQGLCTANGGVPGCTTTGANGTYNIASTYANANGQTTPLTPVGLATAVLPGARTETVAVKVTVCPDTD